LASVGVEEISVAVVVYALLHNMRD